MISPLGEGGMGTVYLCEHAVLGRRFAVKVLRPGLAQDPALVERFRNEAIAASRIGQENVVDVLDFGVEDDGALYYVMEALEGRSLAALIRDEEPLAVGRALGLVEQICRALAAAHAHGVVHRDVKPDNVFVVRRDDGSERAKVIDFGVSHVIPDGASAARGTDAGAIVGTPGYMAPEQGAGEPVDHLADVYAVGVLAFEALTASLPIVADGSIGTLLAHRTRAPDAPSLRRPDLPPEVDALVLRALAKRPEDRHPSMEALADAVAEVRAGLGGEAPGTPAPDRSRARGGGVGTSPGRSGAHPRGPRVAAAVAAVAILAVSLAAWWWRAGGAPPARPAQAGAAAAGARPGRHGAAGDRERRTDVAQGAGGADAGVTLARPDRPGAGRPAPANDGRRRAVSARGSGSRGEAAPAREPHLEDPYASGGLKEDPFE